MSAHLGDRNWDLLVVGGGILGAWCALDARLRGLNVALIEAGDWGCGTSQSSSKLIHGGLRYLERFELSLVRGALAERATLTRIAPHLVRPLRFQIPLRRGDRVPAWKLRLGTLIYDRLAGPHQPTGRRSYQRLSRAADHPPELTVEGLRGLIGYGDAVTDDARLTWTVVRAARAAGALAATDMRVERLDVEEGRCRGAFVRDQRADREFRVSANAVMLCAGPWSRTLPGLDSGADRLVQGTHLVLRRPFVETAFLVQVPGDERIVFLIPWYGRTLLGTTETTIHGDPGRAEVRDEERRYLLRAVSAVLNEPPQEDDVVGAYVGVRALKERPGRSATALSRDFAVEEPARGLWLAVGGKLTTARADAARMVDRLVPAPDGESPTLSQVLPGGDIPHLGELERELWDRGRRLQLDEDVVDALLFRHGSEARLRLDEIDAQPALAKRLHPELPFARVELEHALAHEDCHTVDDALRRRLPLSILGGVSDGLREEVRQRLEGS